MDHVPTQEKEASLPSEPDVSERSGVTLCAVRLPDGTRPARRFRHTDPLRLLFDFVDAKVCFGAVSVPVQCASITCGGCIQRSAGCVARLRAQEQQAWVCSGVASCTARFMGLPGRTGWETVVSHNGKSN